MTSLEKIEKFWNANLCGSHFVDAPFPTREFFSRYREFRYDKEHHLNTYIDWSSARNRDVLEIGPGVGADAARWAEHARTYTAVDLTDEAVTATTLHFQHLGLEGRIMKGNAERLGFDDRSFDLVYSHGVLHHTADITKALAEVHRVLRPDGKVILMLYAKDSFNYWLRIQGYFRVRFLFELAASRLGVELKYPWSAHVKNFREMGLAYFSWKEWPHHCTDGPECRVANIYWKSEIKGMMERAGFRVEAMKKAHFPIGGRFKSLELFLGRLMGFYWFIWAVRA